MRANSFILLPSSSNSLSGVPGSRASTTFPMPSRPAFSIRRLISTRKTTTPRPEDDGLVEPDEEMNLTLRGRRWTPTRVKKRSISIDMIRRSEISHISPFSGTPHSSKSSLCGCDNEPEPLTNPRPVPPRPGSSLAGSTSPPLCGSAGSATSKESPTMSSSPSSKDDAQLSSGRSSSSKDDETSQPDSMENPFDLDERLLALDQDHISPAKSKTLLEMPKNGACSDTPPMSPNNVKLFRQETEDAFRIDIPENETQLLEFPSDRFTDSPSPIPTPNIKSPTTAAFRRKSIPRPAPLKSPLSYTPPALARSSSINKQNVKRRNSKNTRRRTRPIMKQAAIFTENARELKERVNWRIFHRIEVDEMLPEEKLREIRLSRAAQPHSRSMDTLRTEQTGNTDTPVDPFHLDDLSSRIGAAGVKLNPPLPIEEVDTPRSNVFSIDEVVAQPALAEEGTSTSSSDEILLLVQGVEAPEDPAEANSQSAAAIRDQSNTNPARSSQVNPSPSPKSTKPLTPGKVIPSKPLPTIPEAPTPTLTSRTPIPEMLPPSQDDEYIFLPAAPFSLTTPGIRHGRIRLTKGDMTAGQPAAGLVAESDGLDWTAFQVAILGGAGDFFGESTDYSRPSDEDLNALDDLAAWFDDFGFDGCGALVGPGEALSHRSRGSDSSSAWVPTPLGSATPGPSPLGPGPRPKSRSRNSSRHGRASGGRKSRSSSSRRAHTPRSGSKMTMASVAMQNSHLQSQQWSARADAAQCGSLNGGPACYPPQHVSYQMHPGRQGSRSVSSLPTGTDRWAGVDNGGNRGFGWGKAAAASGMLTIDSTLANAGGSIRRSPASGPERRTSVAESVASLPQSPMGNLVVSKDVEGNEYVVSMGYNLSHDLGDYLQWENQQKYFGTN